MEPSTVIDFIEKLGLPVAMVAALGWFLYKIINKMMAGHEENLKKYQEALDKSQSLNLNHAAHIQVSMEQLNLKMDKQEECLEKFSDKICLAIEKQTDVLRKVN